MHAKFWPWGMPWDLIYDHFGEGREGRKGREGREGRKGRPLPCLPKGATRTPLGYNTGTVQYGYGTIPEIVIKRVPGHPPWPEFGMHLPTIPPKVFPCPKGLKFS